MPQPGKRASGEDKGLANALKNRSVHVVHLTHNDLDAVGADAIHRMKFGNEGVFTIWCSVGKFGALFSLVASSPGKGDLLSISDLGYQKDSEAIAGKARVNGWNIEWRIHGKSTTTKPNQKNHLHSYLYKTCGRPTNNPFLLMPSM